MNAIAPIPSPPPAPSRADPSRPYPWAHCAWGALPRFFGFVTVSDAPAPTGCVGPCHLWTGARSRGKGNTAWYGSFRVGIWVVRAHIFVAVVQGKMRRGQHVDHLCRTTLCVNGDHLEVVTPTENSARRWAWAKGSRRLARRFWPWGRA
jgi:hypothetical protein